MTENNPGTWVVHKENQKEEYLANLPAPLARRGVLAAHDAPRPVRPLHAAHVLVRLQVIQRSLGLHCGFCSFAAVSPKSL